MYNFEILYAGYAYMKGDDKMIANCTCTLIKGPKNIIVDTMTPWDSHKILNALGKNNILPDDINYVISTHGHSDHTGNNNLFLKATHIVGHSVSFKDVYSLHPFDSGTEYVIDSHVKVIPTSGHTLTDVTVVLTTADKGIVAVAGDLFECFEDIDEPSRWLTAGSEAPSLQRRNRSKVADFADWIIPGHGPIFPVTSAIREKLRVQIT